MYKKVLFGDSSAWASVFLHVLWAEALAAFVLSCLYKEQPWKIKIMSFSREVINDSGSLRSGFASCDITGCSRCHLALLHHPVEMGLRELEQILKLWLPLFLWAIKAFMSDSGVFVSSASIHETGAWGMKLQTLHNSWPVHSSFPPPH